MRPANILKIACLLPLEIKIKTKNKALNQRGNVLFIILIAVALLGVLTAAIQGSNNSESAGIDNETLSIRISELQAYVGELERAVLYINRNGVSEDDIRFAHPDAHADYGDLSADADPSDQVFHSSGGAATYRTPPDGLNDGSAWEFYGSSTLPGIGTSRADLIAVLPNVKAAFCSRINEVNGQTGAPADTSACLNTGASGRFDDGTQYASTPNTVDTTTFEQDTSVTAVYPAPQACVLCGTDRHFYHVLLAR